MIDAKIELEVHPARIDTVEEIAGPRDQVVVVEQAAAIFLVAVASDHVDRQRDQRHGAVADHHGLALLAEAGNAVFLVRQPARELGMLLCEARGDERAA